MKKVKLDLTGQVFGRLTVISDTGKKSGGHMIWLCRCDCGQLTEVRDSDLKTSRTKSCGCLRKETMAAEFFIHGDSYRRGGMSRLYRIWGDMKQRCLNPKQQNYKYYGGKGIKVCPEWQNSYLAFKAWALANGYRDDLTIDRIDNDGGYYPENCRWLMLSENVRNGNFKRWNRR